MSKIAILAEKPSQAKPYADAFSVKEVRVPSHFPNTPIFCRMHLLAIPFDFNKTF